MRLTRGRLALWAGLVLPAVWIAGRWTLTPEVYGAGHAIKASGDWAAWLLLVTLAVTPLQRLLPRAALSRWALRRRRDLGLASFAYAALHTVVYCLDRASASRVWEQAQGMDMATGWLALAIFLPLALTSTDGAMRALKRNWKRLHRLVHPAAVLVFAHWALTAFDPLTAYAHIAILALIEGARIALVRRQRVT